MMGAAKTGVFDRARCAASAAAIAALLSLPLSAVAGQHPQGGGQHSQSSHHEASRAPRSGPQNSSPQNYGRPYSRPANPQYQYRGAGNSQGQPYRGQQGSQYQPDRQSVPQNSFRPGTPVGSAPTSPAMGTRSVTRGPAYQGQGYRPSYSGAGVQGYQPPGHLGSWLNEHRNAPPQLQQRMLQNDPSFRNLPQADQQRLVRQLNRVDRMPEGQRERRLARAENLERLSPQQRNQVNESARQWTTLPADRQVMMRGAFRDLREVPPDQRQTVLNSARYQNAFSPEERGILSNMLSVEPYQTPR